MAGSAGDEEQPPPSDGGDDSGGTNTTPGGAAPVIVATPREDGSIVHVDDIGQALWTIAVVYKVPLEELLALNGLTKNSFIFPGDELIIHPADQRTETAIPPEFLSPTFPVKTPTLVKPALSTSVSSGQGLRVNATQVTPSPTEPIQVALVLPTHAEREASEAQTIATSDLATPWPGVARVLLVVLAAVAGGLVLIGSLQDRKSEK